MVTVDVVLCYALIMFLLAVLVFFTTFLKHSSYEYISFFLVWCAVHTFAAVSILSCLFIVFNSAGHIQHKKQ